MGEHSNFAQGWARVCGLLVPWLTPWPILIGPHQTSGRRISVPGFFWQQYQGWRSLSGLRIARHSLQKVRKSTLMRTAITKDGSIFFWRCAPPHTRAVPQLPDRAARHDHNSAVQKGVNHFQDSYLLRKTYFGAELPALHSALRVGHIKKSMSSFLSLMTYSAF